MEVESPRWQRQAELAASTLWRLLDESLVGVYVHGSAALGGWTPTSDLDVLVVTDAAAEDWRVIGQALLGTLAPTPAVELSVVSVSAAAAAQAPWPFLVHVDQREGSVVTDEGTGDADLLMHYLVARHSGIAVTGPGPKEVFGAVSRDAVLAYLQDELAWALENADQKYAVLNACRALAYCDDGLVLSKTAGGEWALARQHKRTVVEPALDAQNAERDLGTPTPAARSFVSGCITRLEVALTTR